MAYTPTTWVEGAAPGISATRLNNIETGIDEAHDDLDAAASAATANELIRRDANGRAKVAAPSASDDIAIKQTVDTHAALTAPHSATSAATASRLMLRDASGRAKVAAPSASDDIARKAEVDTHAALTAPHSATSAATADRLMLRDASGRAKVAAPSASDDIARKAEVDSAVATKTPGDVDVDTLTENGISLVGNASTNIPTAGQYTVVEVLKSDNSTYVTQRAWALGSTLTYVRYNNSGTWSAWEEVFTSVNKPHVSGTYTGDGTASRDIALAFTPTAVYLSVADSGGNTAYTNSLSGIAVTGSPVQNAAGDTVTIITDGIRVVASETNVTGFIYNYIAFR